MPRSRGNNTTVDIEAESLVVTGQGFLRRQGVDSGEATSSQCTCSGEPSCSTRSSSGGEDACASDTSQGMHEDAPVSSAVAQDAGEQRSSLGFLQHGCQHYKRRCKLVAPCCNEVFWCRHCHNDVKTANEYDPARRHELDRKLVEEVVCALCDTRQKVAPECAACGVCFGAYSCEKCRFFDDDLSRGQFHCDDCGICRVGGQDKFFHCATCGCCYSKSLENNHICVENSMRQNCPVCFEYLFDSVRATAVLPCGHTLHSDCLKEMERNHQTACPICMKSYKDMHLDWQRIDAEVAATPMPPDYAGWCVNILCNDCSSVGEVPFHVIGLKCPTCASYNTRRMAMTRAPTHTPALAASARVEQ